MGINVLKLVSRAFTKSKPKIIVKEGSNLFNKNGSRLGRQITAPIEWFKEMELAIPKNAKYGKHVHVDTNFGKDFSNITSFYDENDMLLFRRIVKKEGDDIFRILNEYNGHLPFGYNKESVILKNRGSLEFNILDINDRGIKTLNRQYNGGEISETQMFKNLIDDKYVKTKAKHKINGYNFYDQNVESNFLSQKNISALNHSPYTFIMNYNTEGFTSAVVEQAKKLQNVEKRNPIVKLKELPFYCGGGSVAGTRRVLVNEDLSKGELVETINHEFKHQYQDEMINSLLYNGQGKGLRFVDLFKRKAQSERASLKQYLLTKIQTCKRPAQIEKLSKKQIPQAKKYYEAQINYPEDPIKDYDKYMENLLEVEARKAGEKESKKFMKVKAILDKV